MVVARVRRFRKEAGPTIRELKFSLSRLKNSPLSIIGISILVFFIVIAVFAPVLAPAPEGWDDPYLIPHEGFKPVPEPPSEQHPFGKASGEFDIYYGCIWGTRVAFVVGIVVVGCNVLISLVVGSLAGYYGGKIDEVMMRFTDVIIAFPGLILAIALVTALGPSLGNIMKALILIGWTGYSRVVRGEILAIKQNDYVEASKAIGCSDFRVIVRHILPNAIYPLLIMASLDVGAVVLTEAALSFLGLGPPIGFADWGQMISFSRNWIVGPPGDPYLYWYTYIIPGVFIFTFVLGWNLLGDAFRDILDPTLRRR